MVNSAQRTRKNEAEYLRRRYRYEDFEGSMACCVTLPLPPDFTCPASQRLPGSKIEGRLLYIHVHRAA